MNKPYGCLGAVAIGATLLALCSAPCNADFTSFFSENWENENVGDYANQLIHWQPEPAYGDGGPTLAGIATDPYWPFGKFLYMNPPNPPPWQEAASMGIRTKSSYAAPTPGWILSIESKVLLDPNDGGGAGVIGFARPGYPLWGYGLAVSRSDNGSGGFNAVLEIHEFNGALEGTGYGYHIVPIDPTSGNNVHTYELRARVRGASITFEVYWDDIHVPELDDEDITPVGFTGNSIFTLATNLGQFAFFDNFIAADEPILADMNCDGDVNALDIDPFVLVLTSSAPYTNYYAQYPNCDHLRGDCNDDGSLNSLDIDSFVNLLVDD